MKILVVDYKSIKSHQNFNKIHIDVLLHQGHHLTLVGKKGQFDNIEIKQGVNILNIPEGFYFSFPFPQLSERMREIFCLLYIWLKIKFSTFDFVIIPTYDILSFFLFRIPQKVVLINHNNVSQLENKLKFILTKLLPKRYIHIALNRLMEEHLRELLPNAKIYYIPHGVLSKPIEKRLPSFLQNEKAFLFCPVNSNFNNEFVNTIFCSTELRDYLAQMELQLFVKSSLDIHPESSNIISLPSLSDSEYDYMLSHAKAVILPYGKMFKYRCSGILFECVSYNTPVLATTLDDMLIYKNEINVDFFDDSQSLVLGLTKLLTTSLTEKNIAALNPELFWKKMINTEFSPMSKCP